MSNARTAAEWQQAKTDAEANIVKLEAEQAALTDAWLENGRRMNQLRQQRNRAPEGSSERAALNAQINQLDTLNSSLENQRTTLSKQIIDQDAVVQAANLQASRAASGAPNTNTTTPPVTEPEPSKPTVSEAPVLPPSAATVETAERTQAPDTDVPPMTRTVTVQPDTGAAAEEQPRVITREIRQLTPEEEQELRFEQERQAEIRAAAVDNVKSESVPPVIVQPGPGTPFDNDGNLNAGWVQGPNGEVGYFPDGGTAQTTVPKQAVEVYFPYPIDEQTGELNPGWKQNPETGEYYNTVSPGAPVVPQPQFASMTPYDDDGNLMPGWAINTETGEPYRTLDQYPAPGTSQPSARGLQGGKASAKTSAQATKAPIKNKGDWRVRLRLAQQADYLYKAAQPGILRPLQATNGILFPYLPSVSVSYSAAYDAADLTHSNYKAYQYRSSSVDNISVSCDFTAQDTTEAEYILAVIHFFRSVTKMFYGQDQNPRAGTPPPLCYLSGLGEFQYNQHPLVITGFNYALPTDVDYIRAYARDNDPGTSSAQPRKNTAISNQGARTLTNQVPRGGLPFAPTWTRPPSTDEVTYVPTKITLSFSAIPIVTRADMTRAFSVKDYATGKLTKGNQTARNRGIW